MTTNQLDALARILNHIEGRFDITPEQVQEDVTTLNDLWVKLTKKLNNK